MRNWIKKVSGEDFFKFSSLERAVLSTEKSKRLIYENEGTFLWENELIVNVADDISFQIFENDDYEESFVIDDKRDIYLSSFYYQTLTERTRSEVATFLLFNQLMGNEDYRSDLLVDMHAFLENFLRSRKNILNDLEFNHLYQSLLKDYSEQILGLVFVSVIHYDKYQEKLNLIEKRNLKEIFFPHKLKKMLELEENSFEYIYKNSKLSDASEGVREKFYRIEKIIDEHKISLLEYIQRNLPEKKILFWSIWTISPYLALDIGLFFNLLNQTKVIKRIYLDLPLESERNLKKLFGQKEVHSLEDALEKEIKKLYPGFVDDYAKETLPYLVLLEKIRLFNIPFFVNGFSGNDIPYKIPQLVEQKLVFDNEIEWEESITLEHRNSTKLDHNELVIFFFFLKPMHFFPSFLEGEPMVEKLLHGDPFLGYGPQKAENSLAIYSQYRQHKPQSFVLDNIEEHYFKNEIINYYPQYKLIPYPIKSSHFNEFKIFDALLYSNFKDGGSRFRVNAPSPVRDKVLF